jgi:hypothetical protein
MVIREPYPTLVRRPVRILAACIPLHHSSFLVIIQEGLYYEAVVREAPVTGLASTPRISYSSD